MRYRICRRLTFVVSIGASFAAAAVHADDVQIVRERTLDAHRGRVTGIVFGGTSNQFISASMDGSVAIWATASAKPDIRFERSAGVQSISIDSTRRKVLLAGRGGIELWNWADQNWNDIFLRDRVYRVCWVPRSDRLIAVMSDQSVRSWRIGRTADTVLRDRPEMWGAFVVSMAVCERKGVVLLGLSDCSVDVVDFATGRVVARLGQRKSALAGGHVTAIACSSDERTIAVARTDRKLTFWDTETWHGVSERDPGYALSSVAYSPDGSRLAVAGMHRLEIWNCGDRGFESAAASAEFSNECATVVFSPSDDFMLTGHSNGEIVSWKISGPE